ncbi:MAG TPA: methyltransferase domain-containing protein, partial [Myxococcota bacterium]|nr:methyltransferase domain-containing protein [Myxococcota bacterium]
MRWLWPCGLIWMWLGCGAPDTVPDEAPAGPMSQPPDDFYPGLDVPYVPSPDPVIDAMLALTRPQPNERLIDLGCGDGRIVLEALQRVPGLTGVGVDIDPARIREANTNAALRGLTGRVRFLEQNIFDTEVRADVVTLYLLP